MRNPSELMSPRSESLSSGSTPVVSTEHDFCPFYSLSDVSVVTCRVTGKRYESKVFVHRFEDGTISNLGLLSIEILVMKVHLVLGLSYDC